MNKNFINDFAQKISDHIPDGLKQTQAEVEKMIKQGVEQAFAQFKFVKQEEFDIQQKILLKTRQEIDELVKEVNLLAKRVDALEQNNLKQESEVKVFDEPS